jgi:2-iminobutanoate/2-iminopropanoate deaminase
LRQEIRLPNAAEPLSHYTDAVRFGDLLFISGIVALDADGGVVAPGDAVAQTECILQTMGAILTTAGGSFADVLRMTVYLTNIDDRAKINPVRQKYFGSTKPASTLVEISKLVLPGLLVEIEAVVGLPAATS